MINNSLTDILVLMLAVFGISYTVASLHGPFGLCKKLRTWLKKKCGDNRDHEWIASGIGCPICVSFWVAIIIVVAFRLHLLLIPACVGLSAVVMLLSPPGEEP